MLNDMLNFLSFENKNNGGFMHRGEKTIIYRVDFYDKFGKSGSVWTRAEKIKIMRMTGAKITEQTVKMENCAKEPFGNFKIKFFDFLTAERSPGTGIHFRLAVKYLENFLAPRYLSDVTPLKLQALKQHLLCRGKGTAGINKIIRCVKAMMRFAEKWEFVRKQEWGNVSKLKEKKGRLVFYNKKELAKLLRAADAQWRLVILLGARAGLRRGEIINLRWQDIDFKNNQIYVAPDKTENFRYVPMSGDLKKILAAGARGIKTAYVINTNKDDNKQRGKESLTLNFNKIKKAAGIEKGSLHTLRHTFASHLVQAGVDLYSLSKLLGHTSVKTTEIYAHITPRVLREVIKKLPKIH
jgi:integrase